MKILVDSDELEYISKFKKMWDEVEMRFKTLHTDFETGEEYYAGVIHASDIKEIKQKYFPKKEKL